MTLVINGITYSFNADASGNWLFILPSALTDGVYDYTVNAIDVAGNHTSYTGVLTIDTSAPALTSELDRNNIIYGDKVIGNSQPIFLVAPNRARQLPSASPIRLIPCS